MSRDSFLSVHNEAFFRNPSALSASVAVVRAARSSADQPDHHTGGFCAFRSSSAYVADFTSTWLNCSLSLYPKQHRLLYRTVIMCGFRRHDWPAFPATAAGCPFRIRSFWVKPYAAEIKSYRIPFPTPFFQRRRRGTKFFQGNKTIPLDKRHKIWYDI